MAPKLKPLPRKHALQPLRTPIDDDITLGNIRVGRDGVEFTGEGELQVPRPHLSLNTLKLVRSVGKGVQGSVSKYMNVVDQSEYAVKCLQIPSTTDKTNKQTVAGELRNIFTQRTNAYTVELYNAFYRDNALYLVMEYMDWGNLNELITIRPKVPEKVCAYIASQVLHALDILHTKCNDVTEVDQKGRRQIHRDIKPDNVLLSVNGAVKLTDFGIAASAETIGVHSFVGTATYMSPERIQGRTYSTPSDIWSVGVLIAQLLLGTFPFGSATKGFMALLRQITECQSLKLVKACGCSLEAEEFINSCIRQKPEERKTAPELLEHKWIQENSSSGKEELSKLLKELGDPNLHSTNT